MTVEGPAGALELLGRPFLVLAAAQTARGNPRVANQLNRKHKKNRLEAFSDGVFAIAITLLVLEIAVYLAIPVREVTRLYRRDG